MAVNISGSGIDPRLPSHLRKTYGVHHTKRHDVGCHEVVDGVVACPRYFTGWITRLNPGETQHQKLIKLLDEGHTGRRFTKEISPDGLHVYTFPPGQTCFGAPHTIVDRQVDPRYLIVAGDHRHYIGQPERDRDGYETGYAKPVLVHSGADAWVDDFATHQENLARAAE